MPMVLKKKRGISKKTYFADHSWKKMRIFRFLIFISFLFLIFSFLALNVLGEDKTRLKPAKVNLVVLPLLSSAPFFIAQEEGFFTEQGLQIEFVTIRKAAQALPALDQGKVDAMGGGISISIFNAISRGSKIKIVADKGRFSTNGCPSAGLLSRKEWTQFKEIGNPGQMEGWRFAFDQANFEGYYIEKLLQRVGLKIGDIENIDIPDALISDALKNKKIDLAAVSEPWLTTFLQTGDIDLWISAQQIIPEFQYGFLLYGPTLLEKGSSVGKQFTIAYLKAVRQCNQGKTPRNTEILEKHTGLNKDLLQKVCWPTIRNNGQINIESVMDFQKWAMKKGLLDREVSPNHFADPSFIEYANKILSPSTK